MRYGRERGVIRWDAHAWMLSERLEQVEAEIATLETLPTQGEPHAASGRVTQQTSRPRERQVMAETLAQLNAERDELLRQLQALGPSPRAKMG